MKIKIRPNFCETDGFTMGPRDNIVITLFKSELDLLQSRGFITDSSFPASKIFIERKMTRSKYE